jgi:hypothetical protein
MSKQQSVKQNEEQSPNEDLTLGEDKAAEVKGGAAVDYFLKVDGIEGESTDDRHSSI